MTPKPETGDPKIGDSDIQNRRPVSPKSEYFSHIFPNAGGFPPIPPGRAAPDYFFVIDFNIIVFIESVSQERQVRPELLEINNAESNGKFLERIFIVVLYAIRSSIVTSKAFFQRRSQYIFRIINEMSETRLTEFYSKIVQRIFLYFLFFYCNVKNSIRIESK